MKKVFVAVLFLLVSFHAAAAEPIEIPCETGFALLNQHVRSKMFSALSAANIKNPVIYHIGQRDLSPTLLILEFSFKAPIETQDSQRLRILIPMIRNPDTGALHINADQVWIRSSLKQEPFLEGVSICPDMAALLVDAQFEAELQKGCRLSGSKNLVFHHILTFSPSETQKARGVTEIYQLDLTPQNNRHPSEVFRIQIELSALNGAYPKRIMALTSKIHPVLDRESPPLFSEVVDVLNKSVEEPRAEMGDLGKLSREFALRYTHLILIGMQEGEGMEFGEAFREIARSLEWSDSLIEEVLADRDFLTSLEMVRGSNLRLEILSRLIFRQLKRTLR